MNGSVRTFFVALLVLVLVVLGIYALQNGATTEVTFLFWRWSLPRWVPAAVFTAAVLVVLFLYGLFFGVGWRFRHRRLQRTASEIESRASDLQHDVNQLRVEMSRAHGEDAEPAETLRPPIDDLR
ncbi:MAG: LapA family protein [Candidatus Dormiibacterota bacterium]